MANLSKPLWASDLLSVGIHYFAGVVDDAEEVLEKHKLSTQCTLQTDQPLYRSYKSFVSTFLHGRPRSVVLHCLERQSKSLKYTRDDVRDIDGKEGVFNVTGSSGNDHTISFGTNTNDTMPSCTCRDWIIWNIPCKHFFSVFRFYPLWDWNKLPDSYRDSAYLSTDTSSLNTFFDDTTGSEVERSRKKNQNPLKKRNIHRMRSRSYRYNQCVLLIIMNAPKVQMPRVNFRQFNYT